MIDLRSDTVTRPTRAMRQVMANANVGDDVFGEDPTVRELEDEMARLTGKEAALFVTSGTMGNQLSIAVQTRPGDEVIVGEGAHCLHYESGAGAALSGVQFVVAGRGGFYDEAALEAALSRASDLTSRTSLAIVENTHNRSGGRVWPLAVLRAVAERARGLALSTHLDGARLWNASVATGTEVATLCAPFDTASLCFSKGLGAPVGSALCGSRELIRECRRLRKRWGGGMRQAGILAAGALYALAHHRARLADDHANARLLADHLATLRSARVDMATVETNLVFVDVDSSADVVVQKARELGVLVAAVGPHRLRAATHLDVSRDEVIAAGARLEEVLSRIV